MAIGENPSSIEAKSALARVASRRELQLRIIEAYCDRSETPGSLRVICKSAGVNELFRGKYAASKAAVLALELDSKPDQDWHIQTGQGWPVLRSREFSRLSSDDIRALGISLPE